ncbi:hypothetical protein XM47_14135 [Catenovulum maritimum]|uniref:Uncharacterized protein n=1 Tax=Catenovulum maritimum TaxID=1513271 RepID=A0A0J8GUQ9_9ALTE|nr:hypothetical protein XM47_14135 [Catenovulum maritimum]
MGFIDPTGLKCDDSKTNVPLWRLRLLYGANSIWINKVANEQKSTERTLGDGFTYENNDKLTEEGLKQFKKNIQS